MFGEPTPTGFPMPEAELLKTENIFRLRPETMPGMKVIAPNIIQNITSTADAGEVARISADEISKTINRASVQTAEGY